MTKKKKIVISEYLNEFKSPTLKNLIENYSLKQIDIELFFKVFDVERNKEAVAKFILDDKNGSDLSIFGHRASGKLKINAYNGKGMYQGVKCTLGSSHSKFHG